jgi:hypothetical protein
MTMAGPRNGESKAEAEGGSELRNESLKVEIEKSPNHSPPKAEAKR